MDTLRNKWYLCDFAKKMTKDSPGKRVTTRLGTLGRTSARAAPAELEAKQRADRPSVQAPARMSADFFIRLEPSFW